MNQFPDTHFAPSSRSSMEDILADHELLGKAAFFLCLIDAIPTPIIVLNADRQVVFSNRIVPEIAGAPDVAALLGLRPGEALGCIHAKENPGGCGTSESCSVCGAVQAVIECQSTRVTTTRECRITSQRGNDRISMDFAVTASPFESSGKLFAIISLQDISSIKRRRALERIFFHDIINSAGGMKSLVECLKNPEFGQRTEIISFLDRISDTILEEIIAQRQLMEAENAELVPSITRIRSVDVLQFVVDIMQHSPAAEHRAVCIDAASCDREFCSDPVLLRRILVNMVKNALESSRDEDTVRLGCDVDGQKLRFWVHNPGAIPREVQLQLFQRSFSTKGSSRGLGTYSMKLLGEKYLKGTVGFETSEEMGTRFFIVLTL